jgi:beta-1,4-mannosyl-glycoprotein beta-1,4-N-acetylglucosaminyltransferase
MNRRQFLMKNHSLLYAINWLDSRFFGNMTITKCITWIVIVPYVVFRLSQSRLIQITKKCTQDQNGVLKRKKNELPVVDTIMYNGEPVVLVRLELLYEVVDHFYITESLTTFSGQRKPLYSEQHQEDFFPYQDKITWLVYQPSANITSPWGRESEQREFAVKKMQEDVYNQELASPFLVLNTDCDELINPKLIDLMQPGGPYYSDVIDHPMYLEMDWFSYNLHWKKAGKWDSGHVLPGLKLIQGFYTLQNQRDWRLQRHGPKIPDAGWHLGYFLSVDNISRKLEAFSHQEFNRPRWKNPEWILRCILDGIDLFNRNDRAERLMACNTSCTNSIPIALQRFHDEVVTKQNVTFDNR